MTTGAAEGHIQFKYFYVILPSSYTSLYFWKYFLYFIQIIPKL